MFLTYKKYLLILLLGMLHISDDAAETSVHKNAENGLLTWKSEGDGFSMEFIQLVPDYIRAIYTKHNFPPDEVERLAAFCIFGTIIVNTSQQRLNYDVSKWRYVDQEGRSFPVKTKSQWLKEWRQAGITFSWTLLPDSEDFDVGDWQQGFTTIKIENHQTFDFIYGWTIEGKKFQQTIKNVSCVSPSLTKE